MKLTSVLILFGLFPKVAFSALSGKEIMTKNEFNRRTDDSQSSATLTTGKVGDESSKVKAFTFWRKVQADGVHFSSLTRFHSPAEVKNEGILITENASGRNDVLLYLPNFKKTRRVESQQQSGSFMGSVFSYSDIATPHVDDYQYKVLKEEKCPTAEAAQVKCYVIECTPSNEDIQERTAYSKMIVWVRQDNFMMVKGDYYGLDGGLFKKMESNQIKLVDNVKQKWLAHSIRIENVKTGEYTKLELNKVKVNSGVPASLFTQQNLQKVN